MKNEGDEFQLFLQTNKSPRHYIIFAPIMKYSKPVFYLI